MEYDRVKNEIKEDHLLQNIVDDSTKLVPGMMSLDKISIDKKTVFLGACPRI